MSQPTRGRTTGAVARSQPEPHVPVGGLSDSTPPASKKPGAQFSGSLPADGEGKRRGRPFTPPLDPAAIAQTLRAVADALERDPALARRVAAGVSDIPPQVGALAGKPRPAPAVPSRNHAAAHSRDQDPAVSPSTPAAQPPASRRFQPRLVVGTPSDLGPGIPDPFALRQRLGVAGLRAALVDLRLGTLRAIVREYRLDPSGRIARQNDADRLRALIVAATAAPE